MAHYSKGQSIEELLSKKHKSIKNNSDYVKILYNIGSYYSERKVLDSAFFYYFDALQLAEQLADKELIHKIYIGLGNAYRSQGDYEKSLDFQEKALAYYQKEQKKLEVLTLYNNIALSYKAQKQYTQALKNYQLAKEIIEQLPKDKNYHKSLVMVLNNMANILVIMGKSGEAIEMLEIALTHCKEINNSIYTASTLINLADALIADKKYRKAKETLAQALQIAPETKSLEITAECYKTLSKISVQENDYALAYQHYLCYDSLERIIFDAEKNRQITDIQTKYEVAKKDKILSEKQKDLERYAHAQMRSYWLLSLVIAILIIAIVSLRNLYLRNKKQEADKKLVLYELEQSLLMQEELKSQLEFQKKELLSASLQKAQQYEAINRIKEYAKDGEQIQDNIKKIKQLVFSVDNMNNDWETFRIQFEKIHQNFFKELQKKFPQLTQNDLRMCAFIKLKLDKKQIATLLNVTSKAVEISRYRLKKKLNLGNEQSLDDFIENEILV